MPNMVVATEAGQSRRRWPSPFERWRQFMLKGRLPSETPAMSGAPVSAPKSILPGAKNAPEWSTDHAAWPEAGPPPAAKTSLKARRQHRAKSMSAKRISKELDAVTSAFDAIVLPTLAPRATDTPVTEEAWLRKDSNGAFSAESYWTAAISMTPSDALPLHSSTTSPTLEALLDSQRVECTRHSEGCSSCHTSIDISPTANGTPASRGWSAFHPLPSPTWTKDDLSHAKPMAMTLPSPPGQDVFLLPSPTTTEAPTSPYLATLRSVTSSQTASTDQKHPEAVSSSRSSSRAGSTHPSSLEEQQSIYYTRKYGKCVSARIDDGANIKTSDFVRLKMIGKGDVGKVYLVKEKATEQLYAMKVLSKKEMVHRNKVHRVLAEQEMLASLHHPFIIPLHASFQSKDNLYFCMEYCAGGEFFRSLQQRPGKRLPEESAKFYLAEVMCALEYLHLMGFIYRDLKPENILLHASGHIRLADFDLSKHVRCDGEWTNVRVPDVVRGKTWPRNWTAMGVNRQRANTNINTMSCTKGVRTNSFVGTEEYLAPEVISGQGHTCMVDFWTLGIFFYEMVYGHTPFKGINRHATFHNILHKDPCFKNLAAHPFEPMSPSASARSMMKRLLTKQAAKRLGAQSGIAEVKGHPFFKQTNFALLRHMTPPLIPFLSHPEDTRNFRDLKETPPVSHFPTPATRHISPSTPLHHYSQPYPTFTHSSTVSSSPPVLPSDCTVADRGQRARAGIAPARPPQQTFLSPLPIAGDRRQRESWLHEEPSKSTTRWEETQEEDPFIHFDSLTVTHFGSYDLN